MNPLIPWFSILSLLPPAVWTSGRKRSPTGPSFLLASGYGMILTLKVRPISRADETGSEATTSRVHTTARHL